MRVAAALTVLSCLLLTACGGSGNGASAAAGAGETLEQLWRAPGEDVAIVPGTQNYVPGNVRVSFLVVDSKGRAITLPSAHVWVSDDLDSVPFLETTAKIERIGLPGEVTGDATHIYVAHLHLPRVHKYWLLAEPDGEPSASRPSGTSSSSRTTRRSTSVIAHPPRRHLPSRRRMAISGSSRPGRRRTRSCSGIRSQARSECTRRSW